LMGFLVDAAKGVVRTTFEDLSDNPDRLPVGTTLALIEQGMTVFNAIHARLHDAMGKTLMVLHRLNATYLDEKVIIEELGELIVYRNDFEGPMDVIPVSDPNIFSEMQRFAQLQVIQTRAQAMPQLYDLRKVEELILERTKIPNAKGLLLPQPKPHRLNAVNENVAVSMGSPLVAFPDQDHLAHLQVHLSYITNPILGANPIMAPIVIPAMLNHVKDHLALWYVNKTVEVASQAAGMDITDLMDPENPEVDREFDRMLAAADAYVEQSSMQELQDIPAIIQQAMQVLQSMQGQAQMSPTQVAMAQVQAQQAETQRRAQADAQKAQYDQSKLALDSQMKKAEIQAKEQMNREDNQTAMLIAASELEAGHRTNLKNGTGLMKG